MNEVAYKPEVSDVRPPSVEGFHEIKPENGTSLNDARSYVDNLFDEAHETEKSYYTDYQDRYDHTPNEQSPNGSWEGERGESKFVPNENTEAGKAAKEKLAEKGLDGIEYHDAEPDFSECAEATVEIDDMTENRHDYVDDDGNYHQGNFSQADAKCADLWNEQAKDGKTDWTARDVKEWRHENRCSWHERCDTRSMDLVSRDIHDMFKHSGGCAECRVRDAADNGGGFDE